MKSEEIRSKFLKFFERPENGGHKIIPSSSLVPEGDISVLFTTAGMQQFKPYYLAPDNAIKDFGTKNVVTVQKCVRTGDIEEVGDATHLSFFEMLGNFSFGGYGRREAITYAYDFITKEMGLKISYVTYYKGEGVVPADIESKNIWAEIDPNLDILEDGTDVFWGPTGLNGPCGPTTEIYCKNALGEDVEIWNIVFNEYFCDGSREQLDKGEANLKKLDILGIDTGMGLERLVTIVQEKESVYDTDMFQYPLSILTDFSESYDKKPTRIIADHIRTAIFMISDGVVPGKDKGSYVLRKIIRRAVRYSWFIEDTTVDQVFKMATDLIIDSYKLQYPLLQDKKKYIQDVLISEVVDVIKLDSRADGMIQKKIDEYLNLQGYHALQAYLVTEATQNIQRPVAQKVPAKLIFDLITTHGIDREMLIAYLNNKNYIFIEEEVNDLINKHKELSRTASAGMFKGGLANHNEKTIQLHTAHHLLLAALQQVLGKGVKQRGSNITEERLRIDFMFERKMTDEEKKQVEDIVNEKISQSLNVIRREMPLAEAEKLGAEMEFGAKYPEMVSVYTIEDESGNQFSKEFCGGPHVSNTKELGHFKIQKEEAVSAGVRRIKGILQ